jgi:hypothetical protein
MLELSYQCAIENASARLFLEAQYPTSIMESVCRYTLSTGLQYGRRVPVLHILQFATYLFIQNPLITFGFPLLWFERPLCLHHLDSISTLL